MNVCCEARGARAQLLLADDGNSSEGPVSRRLAAATTDATTPDCIDVVLIRHEHALGVSRSLNRLAAVASGRFVARMDADDVCVPSRFCLQLALLDRRPDVDVVGTCATMVDDRLAPLKELELPAGSGALLFAMAWRCVLVHPSVCWRRQRCPVAYSERDEHRHVEDYELWLRVLRHGAKLANLPAKLVQLRKHCASASAQFAASQTAATFALVTHNLRAWMNGPLPADDAGGNADDGLAPVELAGRAYAPAAVWLAVHAERIAPPPTDFATVVAATDLLAAFRDCLLAAEPVSGGYSLAERQELRDECAKRIGQLGALAVGWFPTQGAQAIQLLMKHDACHQLQLLMHAAAGSATSERSQAPAAHSFGQPLCLAGEQPAPISPFHVLVFSKDRPWQVSETLRSLLAHGRTTASAGRARLSVHVIYRASDAHFLDTYDQVRERTAQLVGAGPADLPPCTVQWYREVAADSDLVSSCGTSFRQLLLRVLRRAATDGERSSLMFTVDDTFYYERLPVDLSAALLHDGAVSRDDADKTSTPLCVHWKLHPGITFNHPAGQSMVVPPFFAHCRAPGADGGTGLSILLWNRHGGSRFDWNYPFDLCSTVYRARDALALVEAVEKELGPDAIGHPNHLEVSGNRALAEGWGWRRAGGGGGGDSSVLACLSAPVCTVVTVNRVQDQFTNPVYEEVHVPPSACNEYVRAGVQFDEPAYRRARFNSVHTGLFALTAHLIN